MNRGFLPEIQALRAIAVMLVVVYHVWPTALSGGFIGVDVFFVISGYLITAHLMREYDAKGTISLSQFWARRIRRLLPAAFLVLAASVVLVFTVLPTVVREETVRQIAGASGYILNWMLGFDAVDYLAAGNEPTIVQHYWTLSVEEQFYITWPLLLVVAGVLVTRFRGSRPTASSLAGWSALLVLVISFAYSVYLTWFSPAFAFFATSTRAWEFAAGGLLAAVALRWPRAIERLREAPWVRRTSIPTVAGITVIMVSSFVLNAESPFPGYLAALPVVGTLLVILGGRPSGLGLGSVLEWRPVQFVGDISYSTYLWHWPLLLAVIAITGDRPTLWMGLALIATTLLLAAATKYLIEDPGRRSRLLQLRRAAFALAVIGVLLFTTVWASTSAVMGQQTAATRFERQQSAKNPAGCFGANAVLGAGECPNPYLLRKSVDLAAAADDLASDDWCLTWYSEEWVSCEIGAPEGRDTWALVGDSHAASMVEAFDEYFAERGITVVTYLRYGCDGYRYPNGIPPLTEQEQREAACLAWSDRVRAEIAGRDDISTVVYLNRTSAYASQGKAEQFRLTPEAIEDTWQSSIDTGKRVIWIKDWPGTRGDSIPLCLSQHVGETAPCSVSRAFGLSADPQDVASTQFDDGVVGIDLTDAYCDASRCYSVIGDAVVYADDNHISGTYSRTLMRYLGPLMLAASANR